MKTITYNTIIICLLLCGCQPPKSNEFHKSMDRLEKASFDAGVNCAINAHLSYYIHEQEAGRQPTFIPVKEWERAANAVWNTARTNQP